MRAEYIQQQFENADIISDIDPKELAKEAKLTLIYRLMLIIVWPKIKPFMKDKLGVRFAELIEDLLSGI